jgi:hypothetical protein
MSLFIKTQSFNDARETVRVDCEICIKHIKNVLEYVDCVDVTPDGIH